MSKQCSDLLIKRWIWTSNRALEYYFVVGMWEAMQRKWTVFQIAFTFLGKQHIVTSYIQNFWRKSKYFYFSVFTNYSDQSFSYTLNGKKIGEKTGLRLYRYLNTENSKFFFVIFGLVQISVKSFWNHRSNRNRAILIIVAKPTGKHLW